MENYKKWLLILLFIAAVLVIIIYMVISIGSNNVPFELTLNNSEIFVYGNCTLCTNQAPYLMGSVLQNFGYYAPNISVKIGSHLGNQIISNYSITTLPSAVFPEAAAGSGPTIVDVLAYENVLTSINNGFVLNTPFFASVLHTVTFFNILENRTITAIDIYNLSKVYNASINGTLSNLINPGPATLMLLNSTNMTRNGKTIITFIYSNSPFSAIQSVVIDKALSNFGSFSSNVSQNSSSVQASATGFLGPEPLYLLDKMGYKSNNFSLDAYNLSDITNNVSFSVLFEYDQNAILPINGYGNFMPFMDIGGRFISVSSMLRPTIFNGMSVGQMLNKIATNSTIAAGFNDSVSFVEALLCSYDHNSPICNTSSVEQQYTNIESEIV